MRTIRIKLYKFNELSEDAQQKALETLYDINVDTDWWEFIYEDAKEIGLTITGFDMDHFCNGEFNLSGESVAHAIFENHCKDCETYKTAQSFMNDYNQAFKDYPTEEDEDGYDTNEYDRDEAITEAETDFRQSLLEDYRIMLRNEYEYKTGKEAIIETIEANEYEFTKDGKLANNCYRIKSN